MNGSNMTIPGIRNGILLVVLALAVILIPFFLFDRQMSSWIEELLAAAQQNRGWTALLIAFLLALDIFLPVPSSLVSTTAGLLLGFLYGTLVSFAGMTTGCFLGYWFGYGAGKALSRIRKDEQGRLEKFFRQSGAWAIVLARPVPVLAEASVMVAGIMRMKIPAFTAACMFSNLAISMLYAAAGVYALSLKSFLLAWTGAIILPLLSKLIWTRYRKRLG